MLTGEVALRVRHLLRQIALEQEIAIVSGKVASDHIHIWVGYKPPVDVKHDRAMAERSPRTEAPSGVSAFAEGVLGRHWGARDCLAVSTGNSTGKMIQRDIAEQEGEPVHDDSRSVIDNAPKLPPSRR